MADDLTAALIAEQRLTEDKQRISVEVVLALPRHQYQCALHVPEGTTAHEVRKLALSNDLLSPGAQVDIDPLLAPLGVFGERVDNNHILAAGDRLEIYRPLQQDPKELRRQRARAASNEPGVDKS